MCKFPKLFSPLKVGPVIMKNRIETGPMSIVELDAKGGYTDAAIAFYENLAAGGAAVVTLGESIVGTKNGMTHAQQIRFDNPAVPFYLQKVADAIHAHGALVNIELSHGGCMADSIYNDGNQTMGPSGYVDEWGDTIREMTLDDMNEVADCFADAAEICRDCGFDMVMIHCGHGWLLHQFLSPAYNHRTDEFGGSIENRARFPLMVIDRVRQRVGRTIALDMRISGSEFIEGGLEIDDVVAFCKLAEDKVDMMNISAGAPWLKRMAISVFQPRGINSEFSVAVKKAVTKVPVTSVGGYTDPELMERYLEEGRCDGFILGRSILADPKLPTKARTGNEKEIRQCLRCYICNNAQYIEIGRNLHCSINPEAGREATIRYVQPSPVKKKVLVAGGGCGGMEAAIAAAKGGHDVSLYEKSDALGGWLKMERHIPFKLDMYNFSQTQAYECEKYGVKIHLNTPVTKELIDREKPDTVICAIGSEPLVPPIKGLDLPVVVGATDMFEEGADIGHKVIVIGGGLVGCEAGVYLAQQGHDVTIVEMRDDIAIDATMDHRRFMMDEIETLSDRFHTACSHTVSRVEPEGVYAKDTSGEEHFFPADTVVLAAGLKARSAEAEALRSPDYDFVLIGDARRARKVYTAVREGYDAGTFIK